LVEGDGRMMGLLTPIDLKVAPFLEDLLDNIWVEELGEVLFDERELF
jgi:hypothetical protein